MRKKLTIAVALLTFVCLLVPVITSASATHEELVSDQRLHDQWVVEQRILDQYKNRNYTETTPFVVKNPYGWSPLTALVMFDSINPSEVSVTVKGKDVRSTINHTFPGYKIHHEIPVYGLYADAENDVTLTIRYQNGKQLQKNILIKTDKPSSKVPTIDLKTIDPTKYQDGLTFMVGNSMNCVTPTAVDVNGDVRWYLVGGTELGEVGPIKKLADGKIILLSDKLESSPYYRASFYIMDMMGKVYSEYLRNGLHHDVIQMPNGNFLAVTEEAGGKTTEDVIVELDCKTGEVVRTFDLKDTYNVNKIGNESFVRGNTFDLLEMDHNLTYDQAHEKAVKDLTHDWLHINAVQYIPNEDSVVISARHQNAVFKVNLKTNELVWIMSDHKGNNWPENMKTKLLKPVGQPFEWQYGQHAVNILPNGDIFLYDNGNYGTKTADIKAPRDCYSRAVIYRVDEKNMTVRQIWEYGKERGAELYTPYIGNVQYLEPNHYLITFGGITGDADGIYRRHCPSMAKIPELAKGTAHIVEIKDNKVIYEIETNGLKISSIYRAERMQAYDRVDEYAIGKYEPVQKGSLPE